MTLRGAMTQGALAMAALVAAYVASQKPAVKSVGDVRVLEAGKKSVQRVRYEKEGQWVELSPAEENGEDAAWVKVSSRTLPSRPALPDAGITEAPQVVPERELRGSKAAVDLLARFTPLFATRSLGRLDAKKLDELGLTPKSKPRKLLVTTRDGPQVFWASTSGNVGAPYLLRERDGEVFVLGGTVVSDLESMVEASVPVGRLVERALHVFHLEPQDGLTVEVQGKGKPRTFVALPGEVPQTVRLASQADPNTADGFAKNWHDKLWRLSAQELLGKGEQPVTGEPKVELGVRYRRGGKDLGFFELGRVARDFYARTEHTAGWVKLPPTAEEVVLEAEKLAGG